MPEDKRLWVENHKNRNRHSVKFSDDLEADYQAWKAWYHHNDNSALNYLIPERIRNSNRNPTHDQKTMQQMWRGP